MRLENEPVLPGPAPDVRAKVSFVRMNDACPNCATALPAEARFCPTCGQRQPTHRLTLPHILHEFFHALTHADKGVLHLVRELARRPGSVAREYTVEGKRQRYFNPFAFLVLILGLTVFGNSLLHPYTTRTVQPRAVTTESRAGAPQSANALARTERRLHAMTWIERHNNLVAMAAMPILALVYWRLYRRRRYNYAEHLAANAFFGGFYILLTTLVLAPLNLLLKHQGINFSMAVATLLLQLAYLSWGYYGLLGRTEGERPAVLALRVTLASGLALGTWFFVSGALIGLYIAFGH